MGCLGFFLCCGCCIVVCWLQPVEEFSGGFLVAACEVFFFKQESAEWLFFDLLLHQHFQGQHPKLKLVLYLFSSSFCGVNSRHLISIRPLSLAHSLCSVDGLLLLLLLLLVDMLL